MTNSIYTDHRGDTWIIPITITQDIGGVITPFDLTGATLTAYIDARNGAPGWSGPPTVVSAPAGTLTVTVPSTTTALFPVGTYYGQIKSVETGITDTLDDFEVKVLPTRA
jgi:hypothetical protein